MDIVNRVFSYSDYREFLKDYFCVMKKTQRTFTHRYVAKKGGFSSPSFVLSVMKGERNLTDKTVRQVAKALDLNGRQGDFFKMLVKYNQANSVEEKENLRLGLEAIRNSVKYHKLNNKSFSYFKSWYYPVVRELAVYGNWGGDYSKLGSMLFPSISAIQAKKAVEDMVGCGLLIEKSNGKYSQNAKLLTIEDVPVVIKKDLRKNVLLMGIDAVESLPVEQRHISFGTISASEKTYEKVCKKFDELRRIIMTEALDDKDVEKIYNFALEIYPVSRNIKEELKNEK